jgi:CDGSH-type Zn-finger protein
VSPDRDQVEIRAYPDGPYLVRGPIRLIDGEGHEVAVRRRVLALCRCGRSRLQPLCDGRHSAAGFTCSGTRSEGRADLGTALRPAEA